MNLQGILVILFAAVAAIFTLLNPAVVFEAKSIQLLPGLTVTAPLVGLLLLAAVLALLLMLGVGAILAAVATRARQRLEYRLSERDHEIAQMKSRAYDRVSEEIGALRAELIERITAIGRALDERLPHPAVGPAPVGPLLPEGPAARDPE